jgi:acylphosphatase
MTRLPLGRFRSYTHGMSIEHRRVVYRGRVQGVGFRATTNWLATDFDVSGYVRNLADGTVEVVASGETAELDRFLDAIDREFGGKVRDRSVSAFFPEENEPSGFSIRY